MEKMKNIIIKLGQIDRRFIFLIIALSVLFPLLYPDYFRIDIKISSYSQTVFDTVNKYRGAEKYIDSNQNGVWDKGEEFIDANQNCIWDEGEEYTDSNQNGVWDKGEEFIDANQNCVWDDTARVLVSFAYGPGTMPEIQPMSESLLKHLFSNGAKVYMVSLWPTGADMSQLSLKNVMKTNLFDVEEYIDYVDLGFKQGGAVVISGIATDLRSLYKQDSKLLDLDEISMMENVNNVSDFDFVFDLSAGTPGNAEWVQYACDEYNIPLSSGCTSIMVTDAIPYIESNQLLGILAGMPGAAEYEQLVYNHLIENQSNSEYIKSDIDIAAGSVLNNLSPQSVAHVMMVLLIVFGNLSYYFTRNEK